MCKLSVERQAGARIPTSWGEFKLHLYSNSRDSEEHLALTMGEIQNKADVLVRVHSECFTGDVLGSQRCDCGQQLDSSLEMIAREGQGVLIYLRQEGRGIGLLDKLHSYNLQDDGYDTVDANLVLGHQADERDYVMAACILEDLNVRSLRLLTNNPSKIQELREMGIKITDRIPLNVTITSENAQYLHTKAHRMNHQINLSMDNLERVTPSNGHARSA
jgi:3,4-dihydroxy 2-butanone 4-phosphate synthase/GTP cyclohydrolase II